jgi:peptidoglycan/LPS O-acetylase OafA/YrhL
MQSRNIQHIPEVDHLRLLAALLVFGFHFFHYYVGQWRTYPNMPYLALLVEGHTGVSLFFVLSGFIFTLIMGENKEILYFGFLRNRILRIFPLFLVLFIVAISLGRDRFKATDLLYMFITNLGDAPTSWHFATGSAWSISVEFYFYLIFPFIASFTYKKGARYLLQLLAILFVIKITAYLAVENSRHMFYSTLIGRLDQFLIGMLAAIFFQSHRTLVNQYRFVFLSTASILVVLATAFQSRYVSFLSPDPKQPLGIIWSSIEAMVWSFLVVSYVSARLKWPSWLQMCLVTGGTWSYSFYMLHTMVIFIFHEAFGRIGGSGPAGLLIDTVLVLSATIALSALSYETIEKPFLEMRRRYGDKPTINARQNAKALD